MATDRGDGRPGIRVALPDDARRLARQVRRPQLSVHGLLMHASTATPSGTTGSPLSELASRMGEPGRQAYRVFRHCGGFWLYPDVVVPDIAYGPGWLDRYVEGLRDVRPDDLDGFLAEFFGDDLPPGWQQVMDDPCRWLDALADTVQQCGDLLLRLWNTALPRLDVELVRAELAARSPEAFACYLNGLSPSITADSGELRLQYPEPIAYRMTRGLGLTPTVGYDRRYYLVMEDAGDIRLGYAITGYRPMADGAKPADRLTALLGRLRADLLRSLEEPLKMGTVAGLLGCAPSTASHHVAHLHRSGLVEIVTVGKERWVVLTTAGAGLVETMSLA